MILLYPWNFPGDVLVNNPPANARDAGDTGLIPGSGRSPRGGNDNLLQCSCLKNPMDRGAWRATQHGVVKSQTWLSMHALTISPIRCWGGSIRIEEVNLSYFINPHSYSAFFFFFWRIIALRCCGGLRLTSLWICHNCIYICSPLEPPSPHTILPLEVVRAPGWAPCVMEQLPAGYFTHESVYILSVHWKDWCWSWNSKSLAT